MSGSRSKSVLRLANNVYQEDGGPQHSRIIRYVLLLTLCRKHETSCQALSHRHHTSSMQAVDTQDLLSLGTGGILLASCTEP